MTDEHRPRADPARRAPSVRAHLVLLVLAALLPAIAFSGLVVLRLATAERAGIEARAAGTVATATAVLDRQMGDVLAVARLLAADEDLLGGDLRGFHPRAVAAARALGGVVGVRDGASRQILNSSIPLGGALPARTSLAAEDAAAARGGPAFSGVYRGVADGRLFVSVIVALSGVTAAGDGAPRFLSVALDAGRVQALVENDVVLTPGQVAGVVDRAGIVVARSRDPGAAVGTPSHMAIGPDRPDGAFTGRNRDGEQASIVVRTSAVTGWRVTVTTPRAALDAPLRAALLQIGLTGLLAFLVSLAAVAFIGRRIAEAVAALLSAAAALRRDAPAPPPATGLREADVVGVALADAARDLRAGVVERDGLVARLEAERARLAAVLEAVPVGIIIAEAPSGRIVEGNARVEEIFGHPLRRTVDAAHYAEDWVAHHEDGRRVAAAEFPLARVAAGEERAEMEMLYARPDGTSRWIRGVAAPVRGTRAAGRPEGGREEGREGERPGERERPAGVVVAVMDVDRERRAIEALRVTERRQRLLIAELNHRVKNNLVSVQSLANQTLRSGLPMEEARRVLTARLVALAAAHDVLTRRSWEDAELREVLEGALAPLDPSVPGDDGAPRLLLEGPAVRVGPRMVLALSLAVHELGTNAVKYGALSPAGGRVRLDWAIVEGDGGPRLRLDWAEAGGPRVTPPGARGFGSRLLERGLAHELGGTVTLTFPPEGVRCRIEAPLTGAAA